MEELLERVTAAIMKTGNSMKSQPLDKDAEKLGDVFQGYEGVFSVDCNVSWDDVAAQLLNDVVPKIRACLAPTAAPTTWAPTTKLYKPTAAPTSDRKPTAAPSSASRRAARSRRSARAPATRA